MRAGVAPSGEEAGEEASEGAYEKEDSYPEAEALLSADEAYPGSATKRLGCRTGVIASGDGEV